MAKAPTTARRGRRSASPDAATQGRPGPRRHDRGAGRARRERTLPAMAQSLGRDPSRPFAALAAHEDPSLSHPGHGVRRARQRDAARPAPTEGSETRIIGLASFRSADCDNAGRDQAEGRGSARPRMEWQARACDDPRPGRRLERRDLRQSVASRQGDDRHKLERPSLLRLANGQVRAIRDGPSQVRGLRRRFVRVPPQHRSKTAEPASPDDLSGRRPRHEIGERQNDAALRHLHPRLDRAWPGAGVQLARQSARGLGSLHQEPSS